ncbi:hypothetical protein PybrP1_005077 [[Pythium] brassicae (nom. inval.)]|nr:hypothetical protein PybrP1_005077 [[Pythium] brassicae (nom. inval.)]
MAAPRHLLVLTFCFYWWLASFAALFASLLAHAHPVVLDSSSRSSSNDGDMVAPGDHGVQRSFTRPSDLDAISRPPGTNSDLSAAQTRSTSSLASASESASNSGVLVEAVRLLFPTDGAVSKAPVFAQFDAQIADLDGFEHRYARIRACAELDRSAPSATLCYPMLGAKIMLENVAPGLHSLRVVIVEEEEEEESSSSTAVADGGEEATVAVKSARKAFTRSQETVLWSELSSSVRELRVSDEIHFHVLDDVAFERHQSEELQRQRQRYRLPPPEHDDIVQWMRAQERRASRVRVAAIVDAAGTETTDQQQSRRTHELAIDTEKRVFADLLTHELDCDDSYFTLADKVKHFMHFATTAFPTAAYVMVTDDDAYVRTHELVAMVDRWPRRGLYAGHVARSDRELLRPSRDPGHKNYLSFEQYASPELPPFAFGCHFLLSADCARFVSANHHRLQGLAGLDDVSVALWMLAIQVHPMHIESFKNLDVSACRDSFVSFADLSPSALRIAHANLVAGKPLCSDFDPITWRKQPTAPSGGVLLVSAVLRSHDNRRTQVFTNVTSPSGSSTHGFSFLPSTQLLDDLAPGLCLRVKQHVVPAGFECEQFSLGLRDFTLALARDESRAGSISSAHRQLWAHNLQLFGTHSPVVTAVYSKRVASLQSMLECILTAVFAHRRIRVLDEDAFEAQNAVSRADVAVFSTLDSGPCRPDSQQRCQEVAVSFVHRYSGVTSLIMVSREPWNASEVLDPRVLVLSATTGVESNRHVHVPVASMSFSERREYMFDLLNAMEPVDALGACRGSVRGPNFDRRAGRRSPLYNDNAVSSYAQYKFVIAFESAQTPGYVTEKLVNAFLAGSVPVYFGHSDSVAQLFNPRSFIDCGRFATLRACAERVMEIASLLGIPGERR